MKFKSALTTTLAITVVSLLLIVVGYGCIYLPTLTQDFLFANLANVLFGLLSVLMETAGFIVYLVGQQTKLRKPSAPVRAPCVVGGILVVLGTLIHFGSSMMHVGPMYSHMPLFRFVFSMATYAFMLFSGLCLGAFMFAEAGPAPTAKPLATAALGTSFILLVLSFISMILFFPLFWSGLDLARSLGSMGIFIGSLGKVSAIVLFIAVWLKLASSARENLSP